MFTPITAPYTIMIFVTNVSRQFLNRDPSSIGKVDNAAGIVMYINTISKRRFAKCA